MVSSVWALRHGERQDKADPDWTEYADRVDDPGLTELGHEQAQHAAERLRDEGIEEIYASPFLRAVETADHVARTLDFSIKLERGLCEGLKLGRFSVETFPDIRKRSTGRSLPAARRRLRSAHGSNVSRRVRGIHRPQWRYDVPDR